MAIANLGELRTRVVNWANRADITDDLIDSFINTALERANKILRLPKLESVVTLPIVDGASTIPDDYMEVKELTVSSAERTWPLERKDINYVDMKKHHHGYIKYFARKDREFVYAPKGEQNTEASLYYFIKLPSLVVDEDSNFIVTDYTEILLYGALTELFLYIRNDTDAGNYEAKFRNAIEEAQAQEDKAMWSGGPIAVHV